MQPVLTVEVCKSPMPNVTPYLALVSAVSCASARHYSSAPLSSSPGYSSIFINTRVLAHGTNRLSRVRKKEQRDILTRNSIVCHFEWGSP